MPVLFCTLQRNRFIRRLRTRKGDYQTMIGKNHCRQGLLDEKTTGLYFHRGNFDLFIILVYGDFLAYFKWLQLDELMSKKVNSRAGLGVIHCTREITLR